MKSHEMMLRLPNPQDWMTVTQAAEAIGVGRSTMYDLFEAGKLHTYAIGSITLCWRDEIDAYAAAYRLVKGSGR